MGGKNGNPHKLSSAKGGNLCEEYRCVSMTQGSEVHPARTRGEKGAIYGDVLGAALCHLTVSLLAWWRCCDMASASVSQSLSVGLFLFWTRRAQNDHALYTCRELFIPFILRLLGPSPAPLPSFLCYSYTCLLCSSLCPCCSTCRECLSLIFIYSLELSFNVTALRFPVLYRHPLTVLLHLQLFHILFHREKLHMFVLVYLWMPFSPTRMQAPKV